MGETALDHPAREPGGDPRALAPVFGEELVSGKPRADFLERLFAKIEELPSGCWRWLGAKSGEGYGRVRVRTTVVPAHQVVWEIVTGKPWPAGMHGDHVNRCGHDCVNPAHVVPTIPEDNYGWRRHVAAS